MWFTVILGLCLSVSICFTKKRYRWFYILYKTLPRDFKALSRFIKLNFALWKFERQHCTVPTVFSSLVKKHPEKIAFYFEDETWTYQQVEEFSNKVGNYFKQQGYVRGDTVGLILENRPEYVCIWLGLAKIGVITALINTNLRLDPLVHSINAAKCKALIYGSDFSTAIKDIIVTEKIKDMKLYQFNESAATEAELLLNDSIELRKALKSSSDDPLLEDMGQGKPKDHLLYIYTSGTTGMPKAAVINNIRYAFMSVGVYVMIGMRQDDINYNTLPLYHSAGGIVGAGLPIINGCSSAIRKKFSASNFWKDCCKYNCTSAQYIGELCRYLLATSPSEFDTKHKVRIMFGNGLRAQIWNKFSDRFGITNLTEFYGATEGNSNLINIDNTPGAVGFVPRYAWMIYPVSLIKCDETTGEPIRDADGFCIRCNEEEPGTFVGKINAKKAYNAFVGYADKKATEKKVIKDVFKKGDMYFNSGDVLVMDKLGYFYFKDRTGDTFRWKGENVATSEVEAVISNVVNLQDAVVYGVQIPDTDGRAGMCALVDPDNQVNLDNLCRDLKANLPSYALPLFIRVMKSVPITGTFKLKKLELQEEAFNKNIIKDILYFYDSKLGKYVPLTHELYAKIMNRQVRV